MTRRARVIALGQPAAGDDGVGVAVLDALRRGGVPDGVELVRAAEASALIPLLCGDGPVVLVDALLGSRTGEVVDVRPEDLEPRNLLSVSTHGMSIAQAIGLARVLAPDAPFPPVRIVAVTIARPQHYQHELSPEVAAAVPRAVELVLSLVGG